MVSDRYTKLLCPLVWKITCVLVSKSRLQQNDIIIVDCPQQVGTYISVSRDKDLDLEIRVNFIGSKISGVATRLFWGGYGSPGPHLPTPMSTYDL